MIPLKSVRDLEMMRCAGKILAGIMQELQKYICVNISTAELDSIAQDLFFKKKLYLLLKDTKAFPRIFVLQLMKR